MDLLKCFEKNWQENIALPEGTLVLAACSGGIDSLAMLDMLDMLQEVLGIRVAAAHFEHGIRGQASLEDADFVREFCGARGIEFYGESADVPGEAARAGESLETAARRLRYAFLRRIAGLLSEKYGIGEIQATQENQEKQGRVVIATAHHRDDQAETVLMHLLRGTGLRGLGGIRCCQGDLVRPLLFASKRDLSEYCRQRSLCPRHDATNDEADCLRNRLRLELLPLLTREYNPALGDALCQLADLAQADEDYLRQGAEKAWLELAIRAGREAGTGQPGYRGEGFGFALGKFLAKPLAMQRRLVQQAAFEVRGCQLSYVQVQAVLQLARRGRTGTSIQLSCGLLAEISYNFLYIVKKTIPFSENHGKMNTVGEFEKISLRVPGTTCLPDGSRIVAELAGDRRQLAALLRGAAGHAGKAENAGDADDAGNAGNAGDADEAGSADNAGHGSCLAVYGDWDKCNQPLAARHRQNGDRVSIGKGHKKLKDFLIDSRIPRQQRDSLWLVADGGGDGDILWLPGVRRFAGAAADEGTRRFFVLRIINEG